MRTIEFIVGHSGEKRQYEAKYSPPLNGIEEIRNKNFAELLLETIVLLSKNNPAKELIEVRLHGELPDKYKNWLRTSFTQYADNKSTVVLYHPNDKSEPERLWEWQ